MGLPTAALLYAGLTAVLFRALLPDLGSHLFSDPGDPLLLTAILGWNARHLPLTEAWWNFPAFAPLTGVTAFTEHLLIAYPVASPVVWMTDKPVLAYNVIFLLAKPLNGAAAFALGRALTGSSAAGWIAGLAFAFAPYHAVHAGHLQLMLSFGMPLTLLGLHRYLHKGGVGALMGIAAGWLATALANAYLLVFFPLLAILWCLWFVRPREWRRLIPPAAAAGLATAAVLPLLWGYQSRLAAYGLTRTLPEIRAFSADMVGVLGMFHSGTAWREMLPHDFEEAALFPGFTIVGLALIALRAGVAERREPDHRSTAWSRRLLAASGVLIAVVLARVWMGPWGWHVGPLPLPPFDPHRVFTVALVFAFAGILASPWFRRAWSRRDPAVFFGTSAVVLWLLALGPFPEWSTPWRAITYGPYWLLLQFPGFHGIRVPARIWLVAVLCLAMLAGYGTRAVLRRYGRRPLAIVIALSLLIVVESWFVAGTVEVPPPTPAGVIPEGAVVLDLPIVSGPENTVPQYRAVLGGYRTINGYSGYEPPFFQTFVKALNERRRGTLDAYLSAGDLYVIIRPEVEPALTGWITSFPGAIRVAYAGDAPIYRLPRQVAPRDR